MAADQCGDYAASINFRMRNVGKTPARVLSVQQGYRTIDAAAAALSSDYPFKAARFIDAHQRWIGQGDEDVAVTYNNPTFELSSFESIQQAAIPQNHHAWYYGVIQYMGTSKDATYESRFCYRWTGKGLLMSGPIGYNDKT